MTQLHLLLGHIGADRLVRMLEQRPKHGLSKLSAKEIDIGRKEVLACKACAQLKVGSNDLRDAVFKLPPLEFEAGGALDVDDDDAERKKDDLAALESEPEYSVEEITDCRIFRSRQQYKVRGAGYDSESWQPRHCVENTEALERYEREHPPRRSERQASERQENS